jgi:hypothetical protein
VVLWFDFRIFARVAASIVRMVRTMDMMRPAMLTIWAMANLSLGVNVRKKICSARSIVGMDGSPPIVGVDS